MLMLVQPCEYTKNLLIAHCKGMNFMVCELYLNFKNFTEDGESVDNFHFFMDIFL